MKIDAVLKDNLEKILTKLEAPFDKVVIEKEAQGETELYRINIETEDPSMLIGFHGENIHSLQHLLKVIAWRQTNQDFNILLDVDNYRQRQEENVINLTERKIELVQKTKKTQVLPPMSPYFRRLVHLHISKAGHKNIKTESIGDGDHRQVTIVYEE